MNSARPSLQKLTFKPLQLWKISHPIDFFRQSCPSRLAIKPFRLAFALAIGWQTTPGSSANCEIPKSWRWAKWKSYFSLCCVNGMQHSYPWKPKRNICSANVWSAVFEWRESGYYIASTRSANGENYVDERTILNPHWLRTLSRCLLPWNQLGPCCKVVRVAVSTQTHAQRATQWPLALAEWKDEQGAFQKMTEMYLQQQVKSSRPLFTTLTEWLIRIGYKESARSKHEKAMELSSSNREKLFMAQRSERLGS